MTAEATWTAALTRLMRAESFGDAVFRLLVGAFATSILVIFGVLLYVLVETAWPAIEAFGPGFLSSREWNPPGQVFGALPYIYGTLTSSLLALLIAVPIAVASAVALNELLPRTVSVPLGFLIETLAAVPSIVFGVWGFAVVVPWVRRVGGDQTFGPSLLAAGVVLAIMMLPIVTAVSRDMVAAVPRIQREAALALGATQWEVTWGVVLPAARAGIVAAAILGLGRAVGETMAVIMVIGNQPLFPDSVFDPAATIASVIANEFGDPSGALHAASLVYLGLILLIISFLLNVLARLAVRLVVGRTGGKA